MGFLDRAGFEALLTELVGCGYRLIGPTVRDSAIVLDRIEGADDLPRGVGEEQEPGRYRLIDRGDGRLFGFAHGPDSAKRFLFPARELLATIRREDGHLAVEEPPVDDSPYAFIGLRACDLNAVQVQDRVFIGGGTPKGPYAARRRRAFFIGVNCAEPAATCFCASMGTGPRCTSGFDLALTELSDGFLVEVGTLAGADVLAAVGSRPATAEEQGEAEAIWRRAEEAMGRVVETNGLRELLYRNREHPRWTDVAGRCLACGNCTAVCPTCFCHDVVDASDLLGPDVH